MYNTINSHNNNVFNRNRHFLPLCLITCFLQKESVYCSLNKVKLKCDLFMTLILCITGRSQSININRQRDVQQDKIKLSLRRLLLRSIKGKNELSNKCQCNSPLCACSSFYGVFHSCKRCSKALKAKCF